MNAPPLVMRQNYNPFRATFEMTGDGGDLIDFLTRYSARLQMRLYPGAGGDPLVEALSASSTGTLLHMHSVVIDLVIEKADIPVLICAAGKDQKIEYDLLIKPEGGDENTWFEGDVTVKKGVTA